MLTCRRQTNRKVVLTSVIFAGCLFIYYVLHNIRVVSTVSKIKRNVSLPNKSQRVVDLNALKELRKHSETSNLPALDIERMDEHDLAMTLHSNLDNINVICQRSLRMGAVGDGGWEVCDDPDVRPEPPCIAYSFGIGGDFSFDDDLSNLYGCHVYSFDPSMNVESHNRSNHVHFYNWGIGGKSEVDPKTKWQMYTLEDIKKKLGHKVVDVIKMDVELSEWSTLPNILATRQFDGVKQLYMEYHIHDRRDIRNRMLSIQGVEKEGFKRFSVHKNPSIPCVRVEKGFPILRTSCYEVHYLKRP